VNRGAAPRRGSRRSVTGCVAVSRDRPQRPGRKRPMAAGLGLVRSGDARVFVLDGHDGAGKTTIAGEVARRLGMRYANPFSGEPGKRMSWCMRTRRYAMGNLVALGAVARAMDECGNERVIFDRHWLTVFSVLPRRYFRSWFPLPVATTMLCWADEATTRQRLVLRGEPAEPYPGCHSHYCRLYRELAEERGVRIINTSGLAVKASVDLAVRYFRSGIRGHRGTS